MTTQPRRRWFRFAFSLRTLFVVVTIFGVWLGWQLSIVRERKAILDEVKHFEGVDIIYVGLESDETHANGMRPFLKNDTGSREYARIPRVRRLLGDETCLYLRLASQTSDVAIVRVERAFPEAEISIVRRPNEVSWRDSLFKPTALRKPNEGNVFKTGLIER